MNIAIYIYDNAEVLDFSGPFEVFSTAKRLINNDWHIFLVADKLLPVKARGNFEVFPHYCLQNHPNIDVLIVAGGVHTHEVKKSHVIKWIRTIDEKTQITASVCTGAFLLAAAGLLDGLTVTSHWEDIAELATIYPNLQLVSNRRWVQSGKYITSAGIAAGIDMSLFLVSQLVSNEHAMKTARQMDYEWPIRAM